MADRVATETGPLYLDACATTPVAQVAIEAMAQAQAYAWANPSSLHGFGLDAADCLERSRQGLALALNANSHRLLFTSGGTESLHLALLGLAKCGPPGRLLISAVEHPALVAASQQMGERGWLVEVVPVNQEGLVDLERLQALLAPPTRLVSIIWGQSEVGTIQPIQAIGQMCRAAGVLFHTDAVQVLGHQELDFDASAIDLLSFTAHKIGGPRGIGALIVRRGVELQPLLGGGGQEFRLRSGTESVVLAAGFAAALGARNLAISQGPQSSPWSSGLRNELLDALGELPGVSRTGPPPGDQRLPHHISLVLAGNRGQSLPGRQLVRALWRRGIAVSSGSACGSGRGIPSPVLLAMGYSPEEAASGLRISLGPWLTEPELVLSRLPEGLRMAMDELQ